MFPHIDLLYSLSGLLVGFIVGLTGVGGGSLMTPILVLLFHVHPPTAVGADLLYAAATKTVGMLIYNLKRSIDWRITGRLATGSIPSSIFTLLFLHTYGMNSQKIVDLIRTTLGIALLLTSITLIFRQKLAAFITQNRFTLNRDKIFLSTVLTGIVLGVLVSITSVGSGGLGVSVLLLLYPNIGVARVIGSDIAHAVPLTLIPGIGYWIFNSIDWSMLTSLLVGSLPGITIGSHLSSHTPEYLLCNVLAVTLIVVGSQLIFW